MREVFDTTRWIVRSGELWRMLPTNFPPWEAVSQQARRWIDAGVYAEMTHGLRELLRWSEGRDAEPGAVICDGTTRQSTPVSGSRAGYDGYKRKTGGNIHIAVDTLGHLLALPVTPATAPDREEVAVLAEAVHEATDQTVGMACGDQGFTGLAARDAAAWRGIKLVVVKRGQAKRRFVLLPRRWVVERSFAWATRFRRIAKRQRTRA